MKQEYKFEGTPHINAKKGEFPKTVLFPGDPLRAKWIAETFFEDPKEITNVRGMLGFVGTYKGKKVAAMGSGMGIPSAGIYSHELFDYYDVDTIIRVGTAGGLNEVAKVGKIFIFDKAFSESTYHEQIGVEADEKQIIYANQEVVADVEAIAKAHNLDYKVGLGGSNDAFYNSKGSGHLMEKGIDAVEMEAFGIYANAKRLGKKALAICTVSDNIPAGEAMPPIERQTKLKEMVILALEYAVSK